MKKTYGRVLAFALTLALVAAMVPATPARAVANVSYLDETGVLQTCTSAEAVTSSSTTWDASTSEWYVVNSNVNINSRIIVMGDVKLILADNYKLTALEGITVNGDEASLTIYAQSQSADRGQLEAIDAGVHSAIGGGEAGKGTTVTIHGGKVTATSNSSGVGIGGFDLEAGGGDINVTITGGIVTATGGENVGIGGDINTGYGYTGNINVMISGGLVSNFDSEGKDSLIGKFSDDGTFSFSTGENGNAVICTRNIQNGSSDWSDINSGVIIQRGRSAFGSADRVPRCYVYGNPTPTESFEIKDFANLIFNNGATLTIPEGVTMTNNGTITLSPTGKLINNGTIVNKGTIDVYGDFEGKTVTGSGKYNIHFKMELEAPEFETVEYHAQYKGGYYIRETATLKNSGLDSVKIAGVSFQNGFFETSDLAAGNVIGVGSRTFTISTKETYPVPGTYNDTLIVQYTNESGDLEPKTITAELSITITKKNVTVEQPVANTGLTYNGRTQSLTTGGGMAEVGTTYGRVGYSATADGGYDQYSEVRRATNAGTYTIYWGIYDTKPDLCNYVGEQSGVLTVTIAKADATVTAPKAIAGLKYTGEEHALISEGSVTSSVAGYGTMQYSLDKDSGYSDEIPKAKAAGEHIVYWKVNDESNNFEYKGGASGEVTVTIAKEASEVTPDTADVSVTYGDPVTLTVNVKRSGESGIALASAVEDQVEFTFKDDQTLTAPVTYDDPTDKDSGTATVTIEPGNVKTYFNPDANTVNVSYGGSGNLNTGDTSITVTIIKKPLDLTFTATNREYNGTNAVDGTIDEAYKSQLVGSDDVTASATATVDSADAGDAKTVNVTVTLSGDDAAYYSATDPTSVTVNISKANASVTKDPVGKSLMYNESAQQLVEAGTADGGDLMYYVGDENPGTDAEGWTDAASTITGTDAKEYTIWYYVKGDLNHNDTEPQSVTARISKIPSSVTDPPAAKDLTYTGNAQELVNAGSGITGGMLKYALGDDTKATGAYDVTIPTATNAGTYYVWYMVEGDGDHEDTEPGKVTVEIKQAESTVTVGEVGSATYGSEITLTATVGSGEIAADNLAGTVTFNVGGTPLGEGARTGNTWTLTVGANDAEKQHTLFGESGTTTVTAE